MPSSPYLPVEREFLATYIDEWVKLGSVKVEPGAIPPRTRMISEVISDFFERFTERDVGGKCPFDEAFRMGMTRVSRPTVTYDIANMPQTLPQWYTNQTRGTRANNQVPVDKAPKTLSARTLVVQQHKAAITERVKVLRAENKTLNQMQAWNMAAAETVTRIQQEDPDEYQRLGELAQQARINTTLDYTEQSEEELTR